MDYAITRKGEKGIAISKKSVVAFIGTIIENPEQWKKENLGINKP